MRITKEALLSADVRVSNAEDEDREYLIKGDVRAGQTSMESISGGTVDDATGTRYADFTVNQGNPMQISFMKYDITVEEQQSVLTAVQDFTGTVKALCEAGDFVTF